MDSLFRLTRRQSLPVLAAGMAAGVASVMAGGEASGRAGPSRLTVAWPTNVGPLNPHLYAPNQMFAQAMLYEPLVRYEADGTVRPWLATGWETARDGTAFVFSLRDGVGFSDGVAFDAEAVRRNVEAVLANRRRHAWLEMIAQIEGVDVLGPRTVRFRLKSPYYPFLQDLALVRPLRFVSPAAIPEGGTTADGIIAPVGTGPWRLVETRRGEFDLFHRNDRYWGAKPAYAEILVRVLPDPVTRAIALQTRQIDMVIGGDAQLAPDAVQRFRADPRFSVAVSEPMATRNLVVNASRGVTRDLAVRIALQHAINRRLIVETVLGNLERPAEALYPPNIPYADLGLPAYVHDPARAARLLDEAGWIRQGGSAVRRKDGEPLALDLCFVGNDAKQKAIAEAVQAELARIGFAVTLIGEEAGAVEARWMDGRFGLVFSDSWGPPYDPHSFCSSWRVPSHADFQAQRGLPMKAELDARIGQALASIDQERRAELWRWILTTIHEQAVYLPISYKTQLAVSAASVAGISFGAMASEIPFDRFRPAAG